MESPSESLKISVASAPAHGAIAAPSSMESAPLLGVVIIARNESEQIAGCIESVLGVTRGFPGTRILVVDSNSTDDTVAIACRYPVEVYRYRGSRMSAAAGRRIGAQQSTARFLFFIDGDCRLAPGWLEASVAIMKEQEKVGVICGGRQNAYIENEGLRLEDAGCSLGGTGLYRREALVLAGSFNPFIKGNEEQELLARIVALGYAKFTHEPLMAVHHTGLHKSGDGLWSRHLSGMLQGPGQVLRSSLSTGTFFYHAREFNRYISTFCFIAVGVVCALAEIWDPMFFVLWIAIGWVGAVTLSLRRRSVRDAMNIVSDWVLVVLNGVVSFSRTPLRPESFAFVLDEIKGPSAATSDTAAARLPDAEAAADVSLTAASAHSCLTPAFRREWDELLAGSENVYRQYQSADWLAHLCACRADKVLDPLVARHADGRLAGVVPLLLGQYDLNIEVREHSLWRSHLRSVSILGGVPLLPPNGALVESLLAAVRRAAPTTECIYLHSVPTQSFCWAYLNGPSKIRDDFYVYIPDNIRPLHLVQLPETFESYLAKFKHKKRYNLARQERMLREHSDGRLELRRIEHVEEVASFRDAVIAVIRESWQGRADIPEAYTITTDSAPFEDLARRGLFRSYVLECGGAPRAFVLGYQYADTFHYAEIAYSETVQRFSPGTTLLYMLIRDLIEHRPPRLLNFGVGDAPYKREFGNMHVQDASILLLRKSPRTAFLRFGHSKVNAAVRNVTRRLREARRNEEKKKS